MRFLLAPTGRQITDGGKQRVAPGRGKLKPPPPCVDGAREGEGGGCGGWPGVTLRSPPSVFCRPFRAKSAEKSRTSRMRPKDCNSSLSSLCPFCLFVPSYTAFPPPLRSISTRYTRSRRVALIVKNALSCIKRLMLYLKDGVCSLHTPKLQFAHPIKV